VVPAAWCEFDAATSGAPTVERRGRRLVRYIEEEAWKTLDLHPTDENQN